MTSEREKQAGEGEVMARWLTMRDIRLGAWNSIITD
jgi:hypothetical protein